jgi:RND family efflux transporter MFP subunit
MGALVVNERIIREHRLVRKDPPVSAPLKSPSPRRWPFAAGIVVVLGLAGVLAAGIMPRLQHQKDLEQAAAETSNRLPRVLVASARAMSASEDRVLPGNALPLFEAGLFPRATGYIKERLVDIGDRVEQGQLLAVIDAPDIDDQLAQSKADLAQAKANLNKAKADEAYARAEEQRYRRMVGNHAASQEDYDKTVQGFGVTKANVAAMDASIKVNEATVQRFTDLQGFEKIIAPFPGIITARAIDQGDLVSANSSSLELFHVMRTDVLRVFVNVPQVFATDVQVGQTAQVYRREDPNKTFVGKVTRTANALDSATRTLLTEVQVPNKDGALRAGLYLQVKFNFQKRAPSVIIPAAAIITRTAGPRVATLDSQNRIVYRDVQLGRDFGTEIEIVTGLNAGETVVVRPGDDLPAGSEVETAPQVASKG